LLVGDERHFFNSRALLHCYDVIFVLCVNYHFRLDKSIVPLLQSR